ncbi:MAG TPA: family 20 glycosylhydrolase [Candidatus Koribacter sp.]|jgi:hexosaminidase
MRIFGTVLAALLVMLPALAQTPAPLNVMPLPASAQLGTGRLPIDSTFSIGIEGYTEPRLEQAAARLRNTLAHETGMPLLETRVAGARATLVIHTERASEEVQKLGEDESYQLTVVPSGATLSAANPLGILRGLQTFLQLVELTPEGYSAPSVTIKDQPRFPWRGFMLDVCRHWMPIEVIKRNLDGMEAVKLNVFHWHLSDDQGFRIESKKFPKLQELGSDGHYFTQEQVKEVIAYARDRGIRVIPEFDLPGHSTAMSVAYPELASAPGPYAIERQFGIFDPAIDPTRESTYKFLDAFIGEMAELFPDAYFHIGGDEVNGKAWNANPQIQEFMRAHSIKDNAALQSYFTERLQEIVAKHHKIMVGWDEILSTDLPRSIVIQSWRGPDSLAVAAQEGFQGLLSHGYYLDLFQSAAYHYLSEPLSGKAAGLSEEEKKKILGGEACMWSELVTPDTVDSRIWPRLAAIAERLWSPENTRDIPSMYGRMTAESLRLEWVGLKHRSYYEPMLERLVDSKDIKAIKTLADVTQAPPEYRREELHVAATGHDFTSLDAYNRLVDATHPESMLAVKFNAMVDDLLAKRSSAAEVEQIRQLLTSWRDNDANLRQQIQASFLLREDGPLSANLASVGAIGVQALEYLEHRSKPPRNWADQQLAAITAARQPQAELLIAILPAVEKLVRAVSDSH